MYTRLLLDRLGYASSANFLNEEHLANERDHAHAFRRAADACDASNAHLWGVYCLREPNVRIPSTPVVYVAEAPDVETADGIHRKVWNQSLVPFLLVRVDRRVRLYSGFEYGTAKGKNEGVLEASVAVDDVLKKLGDLHADAIDAGAVWRHRGVDPRKRLDRKLLDNLKDLGARLRRDGLEPAIAHGLIGKFVYLRYLRDRAILSPRRLEELGVDGNVFGRTPSLASLERLARRVDEWLNGSVFPIPFSGKRAPQEDHFRLVSGVFLGDEAASGQLHLDFQAYDFSYIPIETLSVIYEQFLAAEEKQSGAGAYYTPLPVVNFMLAEMDAVRPLRSGMRVLDPACGSGAFLVQCYRRLVELQAREEGRPLRATELRDLLTKHIFGVDRDGDACRVAELSLVLTMLDYIEPPDLVGSRFKLPSLCGSNIVEGDFFDDDLRVGPSTQKFDWVVGNPPWVQLDANDKIDRPALKWIEENTTSQPVVRHQVAEAFAWHVRDYSSEDGVVGLLIPAMSLVGETDIFRNDFFSRNGVIAVANLTNLRRVLFGSRAETAAVAIIYSPHRESTAQDDFYVYSPLVVNQEVTRPPGPGVRIEPWTLTVDRSEIRSMRVEDVLRHGARAWTTAMWGTARDLRLLGLAELRCRSLGEVLDQHGLNVSEGLALRDADSKDRVVHVPELVGMPELDMDSLKLAGRIHAFPPGSVDNRISKEQAYVRVRTGVERPLNVCRPPHVIVNASRTFAVYSDEFIVVPARQIGISGDPDKEHVLRALALFLSSDFVEYHRFLDSTQFALRGRSTLASLLRLPCPLAALDERQLRSWAQLHRELVAVSTHAEAPLLHSRGGKGIAELMRTVNEWVADALGLSEAERWQIDDMVHVRMGLNDGQVSPLATGVPSQAEMLAYAGALKAELDAFVEGTDRAHSIAVTATESAGAIRIELVRSRADQAPRVLKAQTDEGRALERARARIEEAHGQWRYFDRNLIVYETAATVIMKPTQRVWWTRSQALADADELIADALRGEAAE